MDGRAGGWMGDQLRWMADKWTDGWMGGWVDDWMDGWVTWVGG